MKNLEIVAKIMIYKHSELSEEQKNVIEAAKKATETAYAPYSNFHVGAAVLLDNGEIIAGSNQENAAYPSGMCAERTTLFYAGAKYPQAKVLKLAIIASQNGQITSSVCSPCGACRQVILETQVKGGEPVELLLCSATDVYVIKDINTLLPLGFFSDNLQN